MRRTITTAILFLLISADFLMGQEPAADLVITGGVVYTVDGEGATAEALAVKDGRIVAVGRDGRIERYIQEGTEVIDASGLAVYPGFIDTHAHPVGVGFAQRSLDLTGVSSYEELVELAGEKARGLEPGEWILGGGWHQSKWVKAPTPEVGGFPTNDALSAATPDNPVFLTHASGHAALANDRALEIAGIKASSTFPEGGEIMKGPDGEPTGILVEEASGLVGRHVPQPSPQYLSRLLVSALEAATRNGITGIHDAAVDRGTLALYRRLAEAGRLPVRVYAMLIPGRSGEDTAFIEEWLRRGPIVGGHEGYLTIRAVKTFVDGALGSRGAWLLAPYADGGESGHPLISRDALETVVEDALVSGFQVAAHAIGDRANRLVLDVYESAFRKRPDAAAEARFRVEHAQHIAPSDIPRFGELDIIAAMQGIHMASDISWAIDRLGPRRIEEGAYVWRELLDSGAVVVNGTDAPVEPFDPIANFYASVTRRTLKGELYPWSHPEQAMTREEALRSYTADAAYASFEEEERGSIEVGKAADFTILSQDIMTLPTEEILSTEVVYTIVGGEVRFSNAGGVKE